MQINRHNLGIRSIVHVHANPLPTGTEARAIEPQNGEVEIPWAVGSLDGTRRPTAASQSEGYLPNIVFTCLGMAAGVFPEAWKRVV